MKRIGSAVIESPEEAGYEYHGFNAKSGLYLFKIDGRKEWFARHRQPISGWQLNIGSQYYEFVSSQQEGNP